MAAEVEIVVNAKDNYSGVLGNFGNIITGISSLVNLAGQAFDAFSGFAMEGLEAIAGYERMGASLQSLVASQLLMNGAATDMASAMDVAGVKAESLLQWVQELAIQSPFTAEGVALALRQAMAYGFTAEEAQRLTEAMINFAAGTGASESAMSQIALALGQIEAKGKLAGQEVLQLVNAGLAVDQILAAAFGKSTEEIVKMREDGLIPADEAIRVLTEYMETNFAGAAANQANTWAGLQGTFADIKQMGLREFFGGMFEVLQPLAVSLSEFLQAEGLDRLREIGQDLGAMTAGFINFAQQIQDLKNIDISEAVSGWGESFINWTLSIDWNKLSDNLAVGISSVDWGKVGNAIAQGMAYAVMGISVIVEKIDWGTLLNSIGNAFADLIAGLFGFIDWEDMITSAEVGFRYVGTAIVDGLKSGLISAWNGFLNLPFILVDDFIRAFHRLLGISSPSTVFAGIGRDIVLGLIGGFTAYWSDLIDLATSSLDSFLNMFGIDLSFGGTSASGLGTAGGGTAGGGTGGTSGQTVINIYGTSYWGVSGPGDVGGVHDCPSPSPLVASSGNQLVTSGF
ncbi:MAG TPA: tape measure protein [Candidatus Binatia bacterium]|nr:tape measure protein [Candidatus Binatia bacterium]